MTVTHRKSKTNSVLNVKYFTNTGLTAPRRC